MPAIIIIPPRIVPFFIQLPYVSSSAREASYQDIP